MKRRPCDSAIFPLCRNTALANFSKIVVLKRQLYRHWIKYSGRRDCRHADTTDLLGAYMRNTVSLKPGCTPLLMLFDIVILSKKFARLEISKKLWLVVAHRNVTALREQTLATRPLGSFQPAMMSTIATSYVRDPAVKTWVLKVVNGLCEGCDAAAPFMGSDGLPYLEFITSCRCRAMALTRRRMRPPFVRIAIADATRRSTATNSSSPCIRKLLGSSSRCPSWIDVQANADCLVARSVRRTRSVAFSHWHRCHISF